MGEYKTIQLKNYVRVGILLGLNGEDEASRMSYNALHDLCVEARVVPEELRGTLFRRRLLKLEQALREHKDCPFLSWNSELLDQID